MPRGGNAVAKGRLHVCKLATTKLTSENSCHFYNAANWENSTMITRKAPSGIPSQCH